jgi:hypothetical protein
MTVEHVLFLLRVVSGVILLALMGTLLVFLWRDYRGAVEQIHSARRRYGQIVALQEIDGSLIPTGDIFPLLPYTTLGRAPTNSVVVGDSFASSEHALITLRDGRWWLEDRNSRNGTLLNDIPVTQSVIMTDGDLVGIGHRRYRIELDH